MTFKVRSEKSQSLHYWHWLVKTWHLLTNTNICGSYWIWILSTQMTKTFRDNCDINIMQQTSCEPLFLDVPMQLRTHFCVTFVRPCMHRNYGVISGSHACRDCVWHIILDAELYTTCPGERVLVATRTNVTFLPLRLWYVNTSTCFSKDAENLTTYGYVLWCSLIVRIRSYTFNTIIAFYSVNEWSNVAVSVWSMACQTTTPSHFT